MNASKILEIQNRYKTDPDYNYVAAAFDLAAEGCNPLETSKLLLQAESERDKLFPFVLSCDPDRELFEFDWSLYKEAHQKDEAEYKIGTKVRYIGGMLEYYDKEFVIGASNVQDDESSEYYLEGVPYLVWGHEIQPVEIRPADCQCSDQAYEVYGCMCKVRRMPG